MQPLQNVTETENANAGTGSNVVNLTPQQEYYVTFCAANGLSVHEDGSFEKLSAQVFAERLGVTRMTLWRWKKEIPGFETRVRQRRHEIFNGNRESMVWNGLFLRAAKGDHKQAEMILTHFSDYTPPAQRHEVKVTGLADLAKLARSKTNTKVINGTANTTQN